MAYAESAGGQQDRGHIAKLRVLNILVGSSTVGEGADGNVHHRAMRVGAFLWELKDVFFVGYLFACCLNPAQGRYLGMAGGERQHGGG